MAKKLVYAYTDGTVEVSEIGPVGVKGNSTYAITLS